MIFIFFSLIIFFYFVYFLYELNYQFFLLKLMAPNFKPSINFSNFNLHETVYPV
jgi:hypothetical protein